MSKELAKVYEPSEVEDRIYQSWEQAGCFKGVIDSKKKPFTIVMPPPNVTGELHMGHAMDCTLQDILTRFKRMQGYAALWVPGTDHAGIATQIKVEETLRKEENLTRYDLGRDKFLGRVWDWKEKYGNRIVEQQKKMGSSCDWDRARFTMDEGCSKAVRETFVRMFDEGLIYRGNRIINWCPDCTTALSDAEVDYKDKEGSLWHIKYPIVGEEGRYVIVATTRPETMLGDSGVAVHPDDDRYRDLVGKKCMLPLMDREIPIVADDYVDMEFGTGCVKMTPAHDPNDFEVGKRHNLETIRVLDDNGAVNALGGKYKGLDRYVARKKIVAELDEMGLLEKVERRPHNVGTCYRCSTDVEPIVSDQWFVKMEPLAQEALAVAQDGKTKFVPQRFTKIYTNWMENVHDWCISRQLWWGHQIPVWHCEDCMGLTASVDDATVCKHCGSTKIKQDPDVLDTWFSSALWPFSTLGWPEKTPDLDYFYPNSVLVTGYDIIFFWVARMIFSGCKQTGETPFPTVFLHGLVLDKNGHKMSKSAGNGIDPLEISAQYGTDALRFYLVSGNAPGNDMRFFHEKCEAMRNFANKIWNASRFLMMNLTITTNELPPVAQLEIEDKWILSKLNAAIGQITDNMEKFELGVAAQNIYDFVWDDYCDWYIELTKTRLQSDDVASKESAQKVLCYVLTEMLKLLHPYMPFLTEEIWQALPHEGDFLMTAQWPEVRSEFDFPVEAKAMESIMEAITAVRVRRSEMNVPPSKKAQLTIATDETESYTLGLPFLKRLAYASEITLVSASTAVSGEGMVTAITPSASIFMPLSDLVDMAKEKERIAREQKKNQEELTKLQTKLANPGFVDKAPEKIVNAEKERCANLEALISKQQEQLDSM
ncbi:MAG: valine--tRNA ligase [Eubacteriales bacterium]